VWLGWIGEPDLGRVLEVRRRLVIGVEQWAEIRRLHLAEGMGIKAIARRLELARNTVREAVRSSEPPRYERAPAGSAVDAFEPAIRRLLAATPDMPATVIAERIGWTRGMTVLRERVREIRPDYLIPQGHGRTTYQPGELAQWDLWEPPVDIPVGFEQTARLPVIVGVPGYSRWSTIPGSARQFRGIALQGLAAHGWRVYLAGTTLTDQACRFHSSTDGCRTWRPLRNGPTVLAGPTRSSPT
jgi:transposase